MDITKFDIENYIVNNVYQFSVGTHASCCMLFHIYCVTLQLKFERQDESLNGTRSENGRFGSAISNVGDLNQDGYNGMYMCMFKLKYFKT